MRTSLALALAVACAAALGSVGCGGGGGPTGPPPVQQSLVFTPGGGSAASSVALLRSGTGATTLTLEVRAQGVTDLYGVAFDLTYPASVLAFEGWSEGELLRQGGIATSVQVAQQSGRLVVGATRLGVVGGVTGSGTILTLSFRAIAAGTGPLEFADPSAVAANGTPIAGLEWLGGSVQVVR